MSKISRRGLRRTAAAAGAGVIAVAAWATAGHAGPANAATSPGRGDAVTFAAVKLFPMPQGIIAFGRDGKGHVDVTVSAFGLTPGSAHEVQLMKGRRAVATFRPLTANSMGQVKDETLHSDYSGTLVSLHVAVREGNGETRVARLEIARTAGYAGIKHIYRLIPVEAGADGRAWGTPTGAAVIVYDRTARTIAVTVNASGFEPGLHAAHIHLGTCAAQGPVVHALLDFKANARGQIVKQTREVTHVTTPLPATGWYLNLHQGTSGDILANGNPTINFRPLLCGDIVTRG